MTRLKLSYLEYIMKRSCFLEKILMLGKMEGKTRKLPAARRMDSVTLMMEDLKNRLGRLLLGGGVCDHYELKTT